MRMIENMGLATEDEKLQNLLALADANEPAVLDEQDLDDSDVEEEVEFDEELPFGEFDFGFDLTDGLGELGAAKRRRRRRKGSKSRKGRRRRRRGTRKGQRRKTARRAYMTGLGAGRKRRRRRRGTRKGQRRKTARRAYTGLKKGRRRKGRKLTKAGLSRKMRRLAKKRGRTAKGRFKKGAIEGLSDELYADLMGISASEGLGDFGDFLMSDEDGLGAIGTLGRTRKRRRRKSKGRRRGGRRRGRKSRKGRKGRRRGRRRGRRLSGLGRLASMGDAIGQAEVTASTPILGVFEWMATTPGLEALAGVAAAPFVTGLVGMGINAIMPPAEGETEVPVLKTVAQSLISAIGVWELGRLVGSGNIGKFGAFYIFGRLIESQVSAKIVGKEYADKMGLGQVLLPQIKRPDYAVNPLSNFGTVRVPDTSEIGTVRVPDTSEIGTVRVPDTSEIGTVRIPDYEMEGGVGQEEVVTEEELLGQYEGNNEEDVEGTDLF